MKKNLFIVAITLLFVSTNSFSTALTLIHYWNFNAISIPASESVSTTDRSILANALTPIAADFTLVSPATVVYQVQPGTVGAVISYWDATGVQTFTGNQRNGDASGNSLRPRNAWQSMELILNIPSTGYSAMNIMYDAQRSSSGPSVNTYAYSVDGGTNWITTGLSATTNPVSIPSATNNFATQTVSINDANADNNPNLKFRIRYSDPTNTAGNNRIDNITVEGTPVLATSIESTNSESTNIKMYTNGDHKNEVVFSEVVDVVLFDLRGSIIKKINHTNSIQTDDLEKGVYLVGINGVITKKLIVQ
jgi:hypothetical protein